MANLDPVKAKARVTYSYPGTFYALAAGDGRFYAGGDDATISVFDPSAGKKEPVAGWAKHENYVSALAFVSRSPKSFLISGSYDRRLVWWNTDSGEPIRAVEAHMGWVRDLAAAPDGAWVASAGDDMLVHLWDADTGRLLRTLEGHARQTPQGHVTALYALAVSPDGKFLASGDRIGEVRVWEAATGKLAQTIQVPVLYTYDPRERKRSIGGIRSLAFSPDGKYLAVGGIGQVGNVDGLAGPATVEVWDWRQPARRVAAGVQGHKGLVNALRFHAEASWLIGAGGGGDGGFLALWKSDSLFTPNDKKEPAVIRIKTDGHIHRFCLDATGNELYAAGYHKTEIWQLAG